MALIVGQKGLAVGLMDSVYFAAVIFLIITSSVVTPIFLKILYHKEKEESDTDCSKEVLPQAAH